ncbi:MAG TPA: HlyD family secretion protein [Candidatus Acidoferrales bacterium]|nr:HlyD family secretion protein [Candidatus Acidoferrales bacterium]
MAPRADVEQEPAANTTVSETHSAAPPAPRKRGFFEARPHARLILIIAVIVIAIAGFFLYRYFSRYESTDDAQIDGHLMPISARVSGYVTNVNVNDNQYVTAGTVLVQIDPKDYQVALDQAEADLASAKATAEAQNINVPIATETTSSQVSVAQANVENAQAGITAAQQQSDAAQAQLAEAQANNVKAQNDLSRYKDLVAKHEISEQQYDQAVAQSKASAASVAAAQASGAAAAQEVTQAKAKLAQTQADLRSAQTGPRQVATTRARALSAAAVVQQKQAAVDQAQLNMTYTKIIAPVDGLVTKSVEVGMNVQPGQQMLTIVPLNDVWVTANFKETQLKYMRQGQPAEIEVDANGRTYKGHVDSIASASGARTSLLPPENATGNYVKVVQRIPVKIVLDPGQNSDHYLRLGMSVEAKVFIKQ